MVEQGRFSNATISKGASWRQRSSHVRPSVLAFCDHNIGAGSMDIAHEARSTQDPR